MELQKLSALVQSCITTKSLAQGVLLHAKVITLGIHNNIQISKDFINLYVSFHLFNPAFLLLQTMRSTSSVISPWNTLLAACSRNQMYTQALHLFDHLRLFQCLKPDKYTYPSALKACGGLGNVFQGEKIHSNAHKAGFLSDIVVSSSLVGMYAKCKRFGSAIRLFDEMSDRDVACWNTIISCLYQDGQASKALEVFELMKSCGFEPDSVTFTTVLSACGRLSDLEMGRRIHEESVRSRLVLDGFVSSAIVDMYGKCGCLDRAREVFEQIAVKNVVSWNTMIGGYSLKGDSYSCLELFSRMNQEQVRPTSTTISNLLIACSRTSDLRHGKFIHGYSIRKSICFDVFIGSSLIDLYFKCGSVRYAESVFGMMPKEDAVSWNVMISGYVIVGSFFKALDIFHEMKNRSMKPDAVTFTNALSACTQLSALEQGKEIHYQIIDHGLECNDIVMCALLDMYAKCGGVKEARVVFDQLQVKDIVSWTSMIMAYGSHGEAYEALKVFQEMRKSGIKLDGIAFLAVLSACSHGGLVDEGCHYFKQMADEFKIKPTLEHFSCVIDLLGRSGRLQEAYKMLQNMHGIKADAGLLGSLLSACNMHKNPAMGEKVAKLLIETNPNDHSTYVVLANMYASVGKWDKVRKVRTEMQERRLKKNPGCSWIEVEKKIHQFFAKDDSHQTQEIYECLRCLSSHMEKKKHQLLCPEKKAKELLCPEKV